MLSSASKHAMPPEFCGNWRAECLNTERPLSTLLDAGYSVKLKKIEHILAIIFLKCYFTLRKEKYLFTIENV